MKKRLLIVGACGFAGSKIYEILSANFDVVGTCRTGQHNGYKKFDVLNECEIDVLIKNIRPDIIVYASAITDVDYCELNPSLANLVNAHSIRLICKNYTSKLIYLSTDYVFDGKNGIYSERDHPHPINKYGLSKLNGEHEVLNASPSNAVIRVSGLYGINKKGPNPFIHLFNNEHIYRESNRFSSPTLIEDVANVVKIVIENDERGLFHLSGCERISRYEFMKIASEILNTNCKVIPIKNTTIPRIATRPRDTSLESTKIVSLGYHPLPVKEGLKYVSSLLEKYENVSERFEKKATPVTGIIFDCIGVTLIISKKYSKIPIVEELDTLCGQSWHQNEIKEMVIEKYNISSSEFYQLWNIMLEKYISNHDLLRSLKSYNSKLRLGLFNNGCPESFSWWVKKHQLDKIFDVIKNSVEIGISKPSKTVFCYMADVLDVTPSKCLVIDDNEINIRVARQSGFPAFLYKKDEKLVNDKLLYAIDTVKRFAT